MKKLITTLLLCCLSVAFLNAQPAGDAQACSGLSTVTDYDGNVYNTVKIGTQCWMKQNLRTTHYANGGVIYSGGSSSSSTTPYYYNYSSSSIPLSYRGYLYNWAAVMHGAFSSGTNPSGVQGICPYGWHLPSYDEFWVLLNYLRSQSYYYCGSNSNYIAKALAYTSYWNTYQGTCVVGYSQSSNNASGFSAVPVGRWCPESGYDFDADYAYIWTSEQKTTGGIYHFLLSKMKNDYSGIVNSGASVPTDWGLSVRCVHDYPTVTTSSVSSSNLHPTWAACGGTVTYSYSDLTITRGVCWSTSSNPTISNSHTSSGTGTGSFSTNITGLTPSTKYYVRAYATTSLGTVYGDQVSFTTPAFRNPTVTTSSVTNIGANSATCGGTIVDTYNDGISVTARGVCWSTSSSPTVSNSHTTNSTGTGSFTSSITGLTPNTTYYVRAYATTSNGTVYGSQKSFRTICPTVNVSISGNTAIYEGQSTTLTASGSGAESYAWSNGSTGSSITVSPTSTTTYRVTGSNSCGNTSIASVTVTVMPVCLSCPEYDDSLYVYGAGWSYMSGSTEVSGGCRTYRIENLSNQYKYTFETGGAGSASFDTKLYLNNASCTQMAYNDDYSGYNRRSRIVYTPNEDGTYYLKVDGYNGAYGSFTLAAKRECATPLTITGDTVIRAGKSTTLTASGPGPYMWSDTSTGNSITVSPTTTTTYWVWAVNGCGEYTEASVTVTVLPACRSCPEYDATMNISNSGVWYHKSDSTEVAYGCRIYKIGVSSQYKYTFETGGAGSADFDTKLYLYNDSCTQVASNDDYTGYGVGSRIVFTPTVDGTYYLKVRGFSNHHGSFTLAARKVGVPVVSTNSVTNIGTTTATCGGIVTEEGYSDVTARGVCWGTSPNPTIVDAHTSDGTGAGAFTSSITGLTSGATYYVRAYATNSKGTAYGEEVSFSTPCPGDQCEFTFVLTDNYGDGWNGNAIQVTDAGTGVVLATLTNEDLDGMMGYEDDFDDEDDYDDEEKDNSYPNIETQTIFLPICNGRAINIVWVDGNYADETSYSVYDGNGELVFSGAGGFIDPVSYTVNCASPCPAITLPYTENFDSYTTSTTAETGVQPDCWKVITEDVALTASTKPQLYYNSTYATSGSYTLRLKNRCVYVMPKLDANVNVSDLTMSFKLRQPKAVYRLQVGVLDDNGNFESVKTINNASTETEEVTVDFSDYTGNGKRIAFRNTVSSSSTLDYSVNYIDDIALDYPCENIELPYTENFDNYTTSTTAETGVQPRCWEVVQEDVALTNATKPQVYYNANYATSGDYTLRLKNRCVYAMPELGANVNVSDLTMTFKLRQPKAVYRLQVGVVNANGVFEAVKTINNASTETEEITIDFANYIGTGHRIAFRNTVSSGSTLDYSVNYIDNIELDYTPAPCEISVLPYAENFDGYTNVTTAETGVQPRCWEVISEDVALTNATKPQVYYNTSYATSGDYTLRLKNRCVYAMPELWDVSVSNLTMTFKLRQPKAVYRLQVGVVNANGVFEVVKTINNASTETEDVTVNFSGYTGGGNRIAFRNTVSSSSTLDYSVNYIDDIVLDYSPASCGISDLPYAEDFDGYTTMTTAETGVQPSCWEVVQEDVALTDATRPQVYYNANYATSGDYTLRLKNRCVYAMPELEDVNVSDLTMTFKLRQPKSTYRLQVGVVNPNGGFEVVKTINNTSTETEDVMVNFSSYTGSGNRIAFRNTVPSSSTLDYSVNYIDDIILDYVPASCGISELPYAEDFDDYTTMTTAETGVQPNCWEVVSEDVALTDATRPQVYYNANYATSGSYTLRMKNRCIYAMPELEVDGNVSDLTMTFKLRQPKSTYRLQVGVVNADGRFEVVKTINNASTETEDVTVDFSGYTGGGNRIAFRNTVPSSSTLDYSVNYIDDIMLDYTPAPCGISELPYAENFDDFTTVTIAETGVEPRCWEVVTEDVALTNSTKPQVYYNSTYATSGDYTLRMKNRCVYAMPELDENVNVNELTITFKLRQPKSTYRLQVGVVDVQGNFELVKTINNASTETEDVSVDFANYTGRGHRIAFRNTVSSSSTLDYSVNYIDDIMLDYTPESCGISALPYSEDFDGYTQSIVAETGVQPRCWEVVAEDVALTNSTKPQVYYNSTYATSGSYTLRMKNRCVYAMPELDENVNVNELTMTFKLRQPKTIYRLQVGVVDAQGNFTSVKTINNASTETEDVTVDFSNYTGHAKLIAFRNTLSSSSTLDYSINYIDDINLDFNNYAVKEKTDEDVNSAMNADRDLVDVTLYPNPTKDYINVECTMNNVQCSGIEVIDVYGKVVRTDVETLRATSLPIRINVSGLAAGMYFVRVTTDKGAVTKPFVKR